MILKEGVRDLGIGKEGLLRRQLVENWCESSLCSLHRQLCERIGLLWETRKPEKGGGACFPFGVQFLVL